MKYIFPLLLVLLAQTPAHAEQLSLFGGINGTEFDGGSAGDWNREFAFEFGASYVTPLQNNLSFRTGAGVVQKNSEFDADFGGSTKIDYMFLEIPATLMLTLNNQWKLFGGLNLDITLADDGTKSESFAVNMPLGARFNASGPHSFEGILEFGVTDIMDGDIKIGNSVSARYLYDFTVQFK